MLFSAFLFLSCYSIESIASLIEASFASFFFIILSYFSLIDASGLIEDNDFYDSVTYLNRICIEYKLYNPLEHFDETKVKEFKSFSEYSKSENFVLNSPKPI